MPSEETSRWACSAALGDYAEWPLPNAREPALELIRTPAGVVINVDLPGVDARDVLVSVEPNHVRVLAVRRRHRLRDGETCLRCDVGHGLWARSVQVGIDLVPQSSRAVLENGVLSLFIAAQSAKAFEDVAAIGPCLDARSKVGDSP